VNRRLYRCRENRVLAGVASGVAEFFGLDPTLVRVLWFLSIFVGGVSLLLYIGLAIIVPLEPLPAGAAEAPAASGSSGTMIARPMYSSRLTPPKKIDRNQMTRTRVGSRPKNSATPEATPAMTRFSRQR